MKRKRDTNFIGEFIEGNWTNNKEKERNITTQRRCLGTLAWVKGRSSGNTFPRFSSYLFFFFFLILSASQNVLSPRDESDLSWACLPDVLLEFRYSGMRSHLIMWTLKGTETMFSQVWLEFGRTDLPNFRSVVTQRHGGHVFLLPYPSIYRFLFSSLLLLSRFLGIFIYACHKCLFRWITHLHIPMRIFICQLYHSWHN